MNDRRNFIKNLSLVLSATAIGGCNTALSDKNTKISDHLSKVKNAMLAMQRASWEQGTAIQAMIECDDKEMLRLMVDEAILRQTPDGRTCMLGSGDNVTDPVAAGYGIIKCYELFGESKYRDAADKLYNYCKEQAPRDAAGTLYHLTTGKELWSDSICMLPPFLAAYKDYDECIKQIRGYRARLWNGEKKLYSHRWDDEGNRFINIKCWGGGNGWAAASFAIIYELLPVTMTAYRDEIKAYLSELLSGLLTHIRPDGLFYDIVDDPESFVETNLSQMTAFAIFKSVKSGAVGKEYLDAARLMKQGALSKVDDRGYIKDASGSPFFNSPGTSTEAQAFHIMMMAAESKV